MNKYENGIFVIVLFLNFPVFGQEDWKTYEYLDHHFKVDFIHSPILESDTFSFDGKVLTTYSWSADQMDSLHDNTGYYIDVTTYPSEYIHSDSTWDLVEGFILSTQTNFDEDKDYTFYKSLNTHKYGYRGKQFHWRIDSYKKHLRTQVFLIENTLVELFVYTKKEKEHNSGINRFLDSFEILNRPKGKYSPPSVVENKRKFKIDFPEKPTDELRELDTELGVMLLNMQMLEPKDKSANLMLLASQSIYPTPIVDEKDSVALQEFYENSIDSSLKGTGSTFISSEDIFYKGKLGKEYKGDFRNGMAVLKYRVFLIDNVLYMQGGMTHPLKQENEVLMKFLDSFELLE